MLIIPIRENNIDLLRAVHGKVSGFEFNVFNKMNRTYLVMEQGKSNRVITEREFIALKLQKNQMSSSKSVLYFTP